MVAKHGPQESIQQRIVEESVEELRRSSRTQSNSAANLKLISLALSGKSVDFSKNISMIDEMVILRERTRERIVEEIIGIPIAQVMEKAVEVEKLNPQDKVQNYTVEQTVPTMISQIEEKLIEVIQIIVQGCISERIVERLVDVLAPHVREHCVEIAKVILQEHVQQHTGEQAVEVPVPMIRKEIGKVIQLMSQERISDHVVEQTVDIPSLQIQEQTDEVIKVISKGRVQQHTEVLTQVFEGEGAGTKDNDLLCKFHVKDIPCGASQIGVTSGIDVSEGLNVSAQNTSTGRSNQIATTNEKGRWSQTVTDRVIQEAERCQDEDETNKAKVEAKNGLEKCCAWL